MKALIFINQVFVNKLGKNIKVVSNKRKENSLKNEPLQVPTKCSLTSYILIENVTI